MTGDSLDPLAFEPWKLGFGGAAPFGFAHRRLLSACDLIQDK